MYVCQSASRQAAQDHIRKPNASDYELFNANIVGHRRRCVWTGVISWFIIHRLDLSRLYCEFRSPSCLMSCFAQCRVNLYCARTTRCWMQAYLVNDETCNRNGSFSTWSTPLLLRFGSRMYAFEVPQRFAHIFSVNKHKNRVLARQPCR